MDPIEIKCTGCNAKPGEKCSTITSPIKTREVSHFMRVMAARHLSLVEIALKEHDADRP